MARSETKPRRRCSARSRARRPRTRSSPRRPGTSTSGPSSPRLSRCASIPHRPPGGSETEPRAPRVAGKKALRVSRPPRDDLHKPTFAPRPRSDDAGDRRVPGDQDPDDPRGPAPRQVEHDGQTPNHRRRVHPRAPLHLPQRVGRALARDARTPGRPSRHQAGTLARAVPARRRVPRHLQAHEGARRGARGPRERARGWSSAAPGQRGPWSDATEVDAEGDVQEAKERRAPRRSTR